MIKRNLFLLIAGITLAAAGTVTGIFYFANNSSSGGVEAGVSAVNEDHVYEETAFNAAENYLTEIVLTEETSPVDPLILRLIEADVILSPYNFSIVPEKIRPGDPVTIGFGVAIKYADLIINGNRAARSIGFTVPAEDGYPSFNAAVIGVPTTVAYGSAVIRITDTKDFVWEFPVVMEERVFLSEMLYVTPAMSDLATTPDPQLAIEADRLWQILSTTGNQVYHTGEFIMPVGSTRKTSMFGARRVNVYPDGYRVTNIHAGVDIGAQIPGESFLGADVYACGRGRVVLSRSRIISGNTVIIEHAPGIYSVYYHLDSLIAEEGQIVETGSLIGYVGTTGFSTGPHLHWELRVSTENTDPESILIRPLIDKNSIIGRLYGIQDM